MSQDRTTDPIAGPIPLTGHGYAALLLQMQEIRSENARLRAALVAAEAEARRYAGHYPQSSDGRNTFLMLADRIAQIGRVP